MILKTAGPLLIEIAMVRSSRPAKIKLENLKRFVICRKSTVRYKSTRAHLELVHRPAKGQRLCNDGRSNSRFQLQGLGEHVDRAWEITEEFTVGLDGDLLGGGDANGFALVVADPGEVDMAAGIDFGKIDEA